jgi:hypothetical protein
MTLEAGAKRTGSGRFGRSVRELGEDRVDAVAPAAVVEVELLFGRGAAAFGDTAQRGQELALVLAEPVLLSVAREAGIGEIDAAQLA